MPVIRPDDWDGEQRRQNKEETIEGFDAHKMTGVVEGEEESAIGQKTDKCQSDVVPEELERQIIMNDLEREGSQPSDGDKQQQAKRRDTLHSLIFSHHEKYHEIASGGEQYGTGIERIEPVRHATKPLRGVTFTHHPILSGI